MANFITELFQGEPHSLVEVEEALEVARINKMDFMALLKEHHDYLEESINIIMSKDATDTDKQVNLIRFFRLVEMHGKAEEETLYVHLRFNREREARLEGYGGQDEHDLAFQLEDELLRMGYLTTWNEEIAAKAKVVAVLVKNHIKEEESTMFPIALKDLNVSEIEVMRDDYVRKCKTYLSEFKTTANGNVDRSRRDGVVHGLDRDLDLNSL